MPRHRPKPELNETGGRVRISSGALRGRMLDCPQTGGVRPMLSRTRMAMFNLLGDALKGAIVWDCFAGSGLLGIEAVSRGAEFCVFVERDGRHARVVQGNVDALGLRAKALLIRGSIFDLIKPGAPPLPHTPASVVLLDPPHAMIEDPDSDFHPWLARLHETPLAGDSTIVCVGHPADLHLSEVTETFRLYERREYGTVAFSLLSQSGFVRGR